MVGLEARRNSGDEPGQLLDVEELENQQRQRRASLQMRRASLAEVIPDWPTLQKAKRIPKVADATQGG